MHLPRNVTTRQVNADNNDSDGFEGRGKRLGGISGYI